MQQEVAAPGRNLYFEGRHGAEEPADTTQRLELVRERDELRKDLERYRALVVECRSSVKFDLLHYEKMARAYGNIGPEGAETHAMADAEAQRLHELMERIDALALTTPNERSSPAAQRSGAA